MIKKALTSLRNKINAWLQVINCMFGVHRDINMAQQLSPYAIRLYCPHCKKSFAYLVGQGMMIPWTHKVANLYEKLYGVTIVYLPEEKGL